MGTQDFSSDTVCDLDGRGKLQGARLGRDHTIAGIKFLRGTELIFDRRGEARIACLNSSHLIQGQIYHAGTMLVRNQHGSWHLLAH